MVKKISIENFKGFDDLTVDGLERICLFSGKNNIGKSSLLEALFLFMDHLANDSFSKINNFRGGYPGDVNSYWEAVFYNLDLNRIIKICVTDDSTENMLTYRKDENYLPRSAEGIPDSILAQFRTAAKESYSLLFNYDSPDYHEAGHFFSSGEGVLRQVETSLPGNEIRMLKPTRFINGKLARTIDTVIDGIGELELSGRKGIIIDILREMDPTIEDIVTISRQNISQLHIKVNGRWLPLQYAGDGVVKLLNVCMAIIERKDGLLLIDELETGFHYSMYGKLWRIIDRISRESNCQIIATTHSYELIASAENNLIAPEEFAYFRLGNNGDSIHAFRYDYPMLGSALKSELEVR